jgi:hypothetical protein
MPFSATVRRLLISCPSDVPRGDLAVIRQEIVYWNGIYGKAFGAVVLPISWGDHAAAEFGEAPQDIINRQLVDECDGCIAIFHTRLGTPTRSAESGTAEEIERLADAGRYVASYVAVRRRTRPASIWTKPRGSRITWRRSGCGAWSSTTPPQLSSNAISTRCSCRRSRVTRLEHVSSCRPDRRTSRRYAPGSKARSAQTGAAATGTSSFTTRAMRRHVMSVSTRILSGQCWPATSARRARNVRILTPRSEVRMILAASLATPNETMATVTWVDDRGPQENAATLRLT